MGENIALDAISRRLFRFLKHYYIAFGNGSFNLLQREATVATHHEPPLLHVPLRFPEASSRPLTPWASISLDLREMIQHFRFIRSSRQTERQPTEDEDDAGSPQDKRTARERTGANAPLPSGGLGKVTYIKVYANCRLRRIWFSENKRGTLPWEFELYSSS